MADVYKALQPSKYLKEFISQNLRPDGRSFDQFKPAVIHPKAISTADGSCMVNLGDTKICCGIKAELTTPTAENPDKGFVVTNLELPPFCCSIFKTGAPGDLAQAINQTVADVFTDAKCLDLTELCISKQKLVWVIYCDLVCLNHGGSIVDAAIMALIAALRTVALPKVEYNPVTENCVVTEEERIPLNISNFPVASSFTLFEGNTLLANPTYEEEQQCGGSLGGTIIVWGHNESDQEVLQGVHQFGSSPLSQDILVKAVDVSKKRSKQIRDLINTALK